MMVAASTAGRLASAAQHMGSCLECDAAQVQWCWCDCLLHVYAGCPVEIEAAEEAGQTAKAEQLRKAKRAEIVRKLRTLQRRSPAPSPARKGASKSAGSRPAGGSSAGGADGDKPAGRAEVGEADVARIISAWTGQGLPDIRRPGVQCLAVLCTLQGNVADVQLVKR